MMTRTARAAVPVAVGVLLALVGISALVTIGVPIAAAAPAAQLTVFTGSASIHRPGGAAAAPAQSGARLTEGDTVETAAASKAALFYPDGSVTRLDSSTAVTVHLAATAAGGLVTRLEQTAGLTWNNVRQLTGDARFSISGPNSAVAGVRGTEFGYYVEHDAAGNPVIWIDTWSGAVDVSGALGPAVTATSGQRVTVRLGAAPTAPVPIPDGDRRLEFTVFNRALDGVIGTPVAFATGTLSAGAGAPPAAVRADGRDLDFVLAWPGSTFRLTVRGPSGAVYAQRASLVPPVSVIALRAQPGTWTFSVDDLQSQPGEAWWVIVGRSG
jgi:FecR protein